MEYWISRLRLQVELEVESCWTGRLDDWRLEVRGFADTLNRVHPPPPRSGWAACLNLVLNFSLQKSVHRLPTRAQMPTAARVSLHPAPSLNPFSAPKGTPALPISSTPSNSFPSSVQLRPRASKRVHLDLKIANFLHSRPQRDPSRPHFRLKTCVVFVFTLPPFSKKSLSRSAKFSRLASKSLQEEPLGRNLALLGPTWGPIWLHWNPLGPLF